MIGCSEEFYQSLGLPYRVVGIVSGELNNAAARNTIWKLGSHSNKNTKNWFHVQTVLIINQEIWKSDVV